MKNRFRIYVLALAVALLALVLMVLETGTEYESDPFPESEKTIPDPEPISRGAAPLSGLPGEEIRVVELPPSLDPEEPEVENSAQLQNYIHGRIEDCFGTPLNEIRVFTVPPNNGTGASFSAETKGDGRFRIPVPPGKYLIRIHEDSLGDRWATPLQQKGDPRYGWPGFTATTETEVKEVPVITLEYQNKIQGQIFLWEEEIYAGRPISMRLIVDGQDLSTPVNRVFQTDAEGMFSLENLPSGEYSITAYSKFPGTPRPTYSTVIIECGTDFETLRIVPAPLARGALRGKVIDSEGNPHGGLYFALFKLEGDFEIPEGYLPAAQAHATFTTGEDGRISLRGLVDGRYFLVRYPYLKKAGEWILFDERVTREIRIENGETKEFSWLVYPAQATTLVGRIVSPGTDSHTISGFEVWITPPDSPDGKPAAPMSVHSIQDGKFEVKSLYQGSYGIKIYREQLNPTPENLIYSGEFQLPAGKREELDFPVDL